MLVAAVLAAAVLAAACGPSDREQFEKVEGAVQRARAVPVNRPGDIRAAADAISALELKHPKAKAAQASCSDAEHDRAMMYELMGRIDVALKDTPVKNPSQAAEWYRKVDELERGLGGKQERCSQHLGDLWTGR